MKQEFVTLPREFVERALEALKYEKDANNHLDWHHDKTMNALRAALERTQDGLPLVIAGAIFDFAGYLTTRPSVIEVGSPANASPIADLVKEFSKLRGLSLADAAVLSWQEWLKSASQQPQIEQERCHLCDCTGDIHGRDGEWRGECPYCRPQPKREPLTDEQIEKICPSFDDPMRSEMWKIGFKAAHNIK